VIGAAAPFVRVFKNLGVLGALSYNIACDLLTRDNTGQFGRALRLQGSGTSPDFFEVNVAGTNAAFRIDRTVAQDFTSVGNTGNVTENIIKSKLIPSGTLGANGALIVEFFYNGTVQGATPTTFRLRFGGVTFQSFARAVVATGSFKMVLFNANAQGSQFGEGYVADSSAVSGFNSGSQNVDTTVDQTLSVTIQNGAATDNWQGLGWKVHAIVGQASPL